MQSMIYRKALVLLFLVFYLMTTSHWSSAYAAKANVYRVEKYIDTGELDIDEGVMVRKEYGDLYVTEGYIPRTSNTYPATLFGLTPAILSAVNDKYVVRLSDWVSDHQSTSSDYSAFQRSAETYMIYGVPHVIVSLTGSSTGSQTNIPGNICTSTTTAVTAGLPVVTLSTPQPNASETGLTGRFQIDLDAPRAQKTTVAFTVSGTATNGKDYAKIKKSVVIPAGTTSAYVDVSPVNDKKKEVGETVTLNINPSSAYTLSTATVASVTIADND